jgi:hypothetical protein
MALGHPQVVGTLPDIFVCHSGRFLTSLACATRFVRIPVGGKAEPTGNQKRIDSALAASRKEKKTCIFGER